MASGVPMSALLDMTRTTQNALPFDGQFERTLTDQRYHALNKWFQSDKITVTGGDQIVRNIVLDPQGNAQHVLPYQKVAVTQLDQHSQISARWSQVLTRYSISRQEIAANRGKAKFIDLIKSKRADSLVDLANLLEAAAWATPDSAADNREPFGLPYWLNKANSAVSSTGDFIGQTIRYGNASTTTTKGGIDGSTSANAHWRNWAFTYDAVNADFVKRLREAFFATDFQSPMVAAELMTGSPSNYRIYMGRRVLTEFTDLTTNANDNLGSDLAPFEGNVSFRKLPILHAPRLNDDTDDPIYGVNHAKFAPYIADGEWMVETEAETDVEQPGVFTTTVYGQYQFFCKNVREAGFVGSLVTSA